MLRHGEGSCALHGGVGDMTDPNCWCAIKCCHCPRSCLDDPSAYLECAECANTGREPVPFSEVWGI